MLPNRRLRYQRELRGWSRNYIAEKIGTDFQTVARWERGETFPNPYSRQKLCELFQENAGVLGLIPGEVEEPQEPVQQQVAEKLPVPDRDDRLHDASPYRDGEKLSAPLPLHLQMEFPAYLVRWLLFIGLALLIGMFFLAWFARSLLDYSFSSVPSREAPRAHVMPGGMWLSPFDRATIRDTLDFVARAYPTNPGDPAIDHVNFTIEWQGNWRIACDVQAPLPDSTFRCSVNLNMLGAPPGMLRISFDVYDRMGNYNKAPNGIHTVYFAP